MDRKKVQLGLMFAIIVIVYNIVLFLLAKTLHTSFWVSYGFIMFSILMCVISFFFVSNEKRKSQVVGMPVTVLSSLYFVIEFQNRQALYERIDRRVDLMLRNGLAEEARRCLADGGRTAAQAIGHKELLPYFEGSISLEEAAENIKRETRRYAKRQITWFKRRADAVRLTADGNTDIVRTAVKLSRDFLNG